MWIIDTLFQGGDLHKYTWPKNAFNQRLLICFSWRVPCSDRQQGIHKRTGLGDPTEWSGGPGGQRKKDVCRQRIVLVPTAPGMRSGRRGGEAVVQSSCSFICCSKRLAVANIRKCVAKNAVYKAWFQNITVPWGAKVRSPHGEKTGLQLLASQQNMLVNHPAPWQNIW